MVSLFRERDFRLHFTGHGISAVGNAAGALAAGGLATATSPQVALVVVLALLALCSIWLRMSPVGRVRTLAELGQPVGRVRE